MQVDVRDALERDVESCLSAALPAVDVREVSILRTGTDAAFRVVIDHPEGVDHDLCERVTRALQAEGLGDDFGIEVWSPGPEPPLRTLAHFETAIGRRVALTVDVGDRRRKREGVLTAVDDRGVTLTGEDGATEYPFADIRKARDLDGDGRW